MKNFIKLGMIALAVSLNVSHAVNAQEVIKDIITTPTVHNQEDIYGGKFRHREGDRNYFTVEPEQKEVVLDLDKYNKDDIHEFVYTGVKNDMRFKLIAPKHYAFVFQDKNFNEVQSREYYLNIKEGSQRQLNIAIKEDYKTEILGRGYSFTMRKY